MSKRRFTLQPFVSREETVVRKDGTIEQVPIQLWQASGGHVVLRIGRTTLHFDELGRYDGTEHDCKGFTPEQAEAIVASMARTRENLGKPPDETYYPPGTPGWRAETESLAYHAQSGDLKPYVHVPKKGDRDPHEPN